MTISNRLNRTTLLGNGISTGVPITFPFHSADDLVVIETILATGAQTIKVMTTHYTVSGTADALGHYPTGGTVTMLTAPASTVSITVYRDVAALQQVVLVENEKIPVKASIEAPFDRLTMIAQRLIDRVDRAMVQPDGDAAAIGRLPAKVVRASRYMGFDGDGNPTLMQTPTGMITSIAQLTESTYAELPAPGAAGTLRKVTDTVRGVWMDTGSQWAAVNGGVANVRDFGAKGDGVTDDTAAIQAALDTGAPVCIPYGNFVISNALLLRVNRQRLFGCGKGSRLLCTPSSGLFCAVAITENTTDIELDNLTLLGNASSEPAGPSPVRGIVAGTNSTGTAHSAIEWDARASIHDLYISGITPGATGFNVGIQINKANNSSIAHLVIDSLYGTNGNYGYGIVCHGDHIAIAHVNVKATISGQGRHAFYLTSAPNYVRVIDCSAENFQNEPFTSNISSGGVGMEFINCLAMNCAQATVGSHDALFSFHGGSKGRISGCRGYGSVSASNNFGVTVKDHDFATVSDVYLENIDRHGVYVENADYTQISAIKMNLIGIEDISLYGGVTIIQSNYCELDGVQVKGPGRFVARLDSSAPQPTFCRFRNLSYSGSFTYEIENYAIGTDTNRVSMNSIPLVQRANLATAAAGMGSVVVIDDNGSGDRNLVLYAGGQRFRIDGGANI